MAVHMEDIKITWIVVKSRPFLLAYVYPLNWTQPKNIKEWIGSFWFSCLRENERLGALMERFTTASTFQTVYYLFL